LVPEERRSQGLILQKNVRFNLSLVNLRQLRILRWFPALSMRRLDRQARDIVAKLSVRPERTDTVVSRLSGGNQQKVVIGKWLATRSSVLILDEPTRGVDVSARAEIHRVMRELADSGMGVLVIASEFAELLDCDRVLVMDRGAIVGELRGGDITEQAILRLCYTEDEATA
jgi:ribose transport system ATP-binding protein